MPTLSASAVQIREALAGRPEVRLAILFGSVARGTAGPQSDVDVAVEAPGVDVLSLVALLAEAVGREVDIVSIEDVGIPLLQRLLLEGVIVHEGSRGAGASWRTRALLMLETDAPWYARMRNAWLARVSQVGLPHG